MFPVWVWFVALALGLMAVLAAFGPDIVRDALHAPVGLGVSALLLFLFCEVPQMQGMLMASLGGGRDGHYDTAWWRQLDLPVGNLLFAAQAWFWTRAALNAAAGRRDGAVGADQLPASERFLGRAGVQLSMLIPLALAFVVTGGHVTMVPAPWVGILLSIGLTALLAIALDRRREFAPSTYNPPGARPRSLTARVFAGAPYGPRAAAFMLGLALAGMAVMEAAPGVVDALFHTVSAVLVAASCTIAVATVLLSLLRDASFAVLSRTSAWMRTAADARGLARGRSALRPLPPRALADVADVTGIVLLIAVPLLGSELAGWAHAYRIAGSARPSASDRQALPILQPEADACLWGDDGARYAGRDGVRRPIVLALAGGASRSAAWSLSVAHWMDFATNGAFGQHLYAISSVSGGSLGAITWGLLRARGVQPRDDAFLAAAAMLARRDLLPAVAGRLFSVDLLTGLPTRGPALAGAFERYWSDSHLASEAPTFAEAAASRDPCAAQLLLNGTDVETGTRLVTGSASVASGPAPVASAAFDLRKEHDFSAADAVLNSARFPIVSPPGGIARRGRGTDWSIVDGGVYEASGLALAADVVARLRTRDPHAPDLRPIVVLIDNSGIDLAKAALPFGGGVACSASQQTAEGSAKAADRAGSFPVPEILTSLTGLNATRFTRTSVDLARIQALLCDAEADVLVFDLAAPASPVPAVPMNWVLNRVNCEVILGTGRQLDANRDAATRLAILLDALPSGSSSGPAPDESAWCGRDVRSALPSKL